jgi:hypothetical protein
MIEAREKFIQRVALNFMNTKLSVENSIQAETWEGFFTQVLEHLRDNVEEANALYRDPNHYDDTQLIVDGHTGSPVSKQDVEHVISRVPEYFREDDDDVHYKVSN